MWRKHPASSALRSSLRRLVLGSASRGCLIEDYGLGCPQASLYTSWWFTLTVSVSEPKGGCSAILLIIHAGHTLMRGVMSFTNFWYSEGARGGMRAPAAFRRPMYCGLHWQLRHTWSSLMDLLWRLNTCWHLHPKSLNIRLIIAFGPSAEVRA